MLFLNVKTRHEKERRIYSPALNFGLYGLKKSHFKMIVRKKCVISLKLCFYIKKKNGLNRIGKPFFVVAEAGFEPTTFGL